MSNRGAPAAASQRPPNFFQQQVKEAQSKLNEVKGAISGQQRADSGIPNGLLERLSSRERIAALARLVDPEAEFEPEALEMIDEVLGAWVDDVTEQAAGITNLGRKGPADKAVLSEDDIHAAVRDVCPSLILPTDSLAASSAPRAPPLESLKRARAEAAQVRANEAAAAAGGGSNPTAMDMHLPAAVGGAGLDEEDLARKRARSAGGSLLKAAHSSAPLYDPRTGELIKRPRGRPSNKWLEEHRDALEAAARKEAEKAARMGGVPVAGAGAAGAGAVAPVAAKPAGPAAGPKR